MAESCFCYVLKRNDTGQYYTGNYKPALKDRWSPKLLKAKKYKRICDVTNAISCMREMNKSKDYPWIFIPQIFSVVVYGLEKLMEQPL